mmetsp:Transcript_93539/g.291106  ORF Transcript_93539/g.291106 Transcript_93539/m.291106 type:complete len:98 (+) Transcript_93539:923-1216(+)
MWADNVQYFIETSVLAERRRGKALTVEVDGTLHGMNHGGGNDAGPEIPEWKVIISQGRAPQEDREHGPAESSAPLAAPRCWWPGLHLLNTFLVGAVS